MNHKPHSILLAVLTLGVSTFLVSPSFASPDIGEKAPKISIAKWLSAKPPALPNEKGAKKHVFLVEFWAPWLARCQESIPHLSELQKKHKKDGLIVIGVSNEEPELIEKFIEKKMKMAYFVGSDDAMRTTTAYADDVQTIPYAFIVDKSGVIVWRGDPLADRDAMDGVITQVLAGEYDIEAAKNAASTEKKYKKLFTELRPAYAAREEDKVFKIIEELIALRPLELQLYLIKRDFLRDFDREGEISDWEAKIEDAFKDSASKLRRIAQFEHAKPLFIRAPGLMFRCILRANELSRGRDVETLSLLAEIQCELGLIDAAIDSQTQAVGLASDELVEQHKKTLAYYKAVKVVTQAFRDRPATGAGSSE